MKRTMAIFNMALVAAILSGCVYSEPSSLPPGQYEYTSKSVDSKGTAREQERTTEVYYDKDGNKQVTVDQKTTTDPKGLFNKSTTETRKTTE